MSEAARDSGRASAAGGAVPTKTLYCSFCFKSQHDVRKLIAGPAGIFICDECVALCDEIIAGHLPTTKPPADHQVPTERLLERLAAIEQTRQGEGKSACRAWSSFCARAR